jgi:hypothetical protein
MRPVFRDLRFPKMFWELRPLGILRSSTRTVDTGGRTCDMLLCTKYHISVSHRLQRTYLSGLLKEAQFYISIDLRAKGLGLSISSAGSRTWCLYLIAAQCTYFLWQNGPGRPGQLVYQQLQGITIFQQNKSRTDTLSLSVCCCVLHS